MNHNEQWKYRAVWCVLVWCIIHVHVLAKRLPVQKYCTSVDIFFFLPPVLMQQWRLLDETTIQRQRLLSGTLNLAQDASGCLPGNRLPICFFFSRHMCTRLLALCVLSICRRVVFHVLFSPRLMASQKILLVLDGRKKLLFCMSWTPRPLVFSARYKKVRGLSCCCLLLTHHDMLARSYGNSDSRALAAAARLVLWMHYVIWWLIINNWLDITGYFS